MYILDFFLIDRQLLTSTLLTRGCMLVLLLSSWIENSHGWLNISDTSVVICDAVTAYLSKAAITWVNTVFWHGLCWHGLCCSSLVCFVFVYGEYLSLCSVSLMFVFLFWFAIVFNHVSISSVFLKSYSLTLNDSCWSLNTFRWKIILSYSNGSTEPINVFRWNFSYLVSRSNLNSFDIFFSSGFAWSSIFITQVTMN
jgi:hypothetical protein